MERMEIRSDRGRGRGEPAPVAVCRAGSLGARTVVHRPHELRGLEWDALAFEIKGGHAAASLAGNSARSAGKGVPAAFAANLKCAMRDAGMPMERQLWTVEIGASISLATADVPPR